MNTALLPGVKAAPDYRAAIAALHAEFGIPADYGERRQLPLCEEAKELVSIGSDILAREQQLAPRAAAAWQRMQAAAARDGVQLLVVSAFRSVDYQAALIRRKLDRGMAIADVLKINAAPGYSEHHTGRALDLSTPESQPLEVGFETTVAYTWLTRHAGEHGFRLSYPRDNPHGINYEPWHWAFHDV
ncbi:MAG TPA: M15 family metallopeptidase [Gammaproteobacteria bacterium]|nr:M15 family metallopeptidase [Gammaproteobacteria bacterium]